METRLTNKQEKRKKEIVDLKFRLIAEKTLFARVTRRFVARKFRSSSCSKKRERRGSLLKVEIGGGSIFLRNNSCATQEDRGSIDHHERPSKPTTHLVIIVHDANNINTRGTS